MRKFTGNENEQERFPKSAANAYWSEGQVATRLCISVQWLRKERALARGIPYRKFGRSVKYKITDVLAYEDAATVSFPKYKRARQQTKLSA